MGCDIHGWVERKVFHGWVAVSELRDKGRNRNYQRFAKLAGVRGDGPVARGIPLDVSETAKYHIERWGSDGHSHSWIELKDAAKIFAETAWNPSEYELKWPESAYFDVDLDYRKGGSIDEYRLVFWFDN